MSQQDGIGTVTSPPESRANALTPCKTPVRQELFPRLGRRLGIARRRCLARNTGELTGVPAAQEVIHGEGTDVNAIELRLNLRRPGDDMKVLIVVLDTVLPAAAPDAEVLVITPALNSPLRRWVSDEDAARRLAQERAAAYVEQLTQHGRRAEGRVGDPDPSQAIADALRTFPADAIVIAARPDRSDLLVDELVSRTRNRFGLPVLRAGESHSRAA